MKLETLTILIVSTFALSGCVGSMSENAPGGAITGGNEFEQSGENMMPANSTPNKKMWVESCLTYFESYPHTVVPADFDLPILNWSEIPNANKSEQIAHHIVQVYQGANRSLVKVDTEQDASWVNFTNFVRQWHPEGGKQTFDFFIEIETHVVEADVSIVCTTRPVDG